jgi:hypothetical protein
MFKWTKNKIKEAGEFGSEVINLRQIKETSGDIAKMAKETLDPRNKKTEKPETFEHAKTRLNLKLNDINQVYYNYSLSFYIALIVSLICFIYLIYALFIERKIMASLSALAILSFLLANCFQFSFRAFQIKHQKLCSVKDWWNRGNDWFPSITKEIIKPSSSRDIVRK